MKPDLVLIDDDELVRSTWEYLAKMKGHNLVVFTHPNYFDFGIEKDVPIYVDYSLYEVELGAAFSARLLSEGYKTVFIATGHPHDEIAAPKGLSGIRGKEYPKP